MTGRTRIKINEDSIFPLLVKGSLLLAAGMGTVTAFLISPRFGVSLFAGGVLATANFIWLRRGVEAALLMAPAKAPRFAVFRYLLRLAILALLLYAMIVRLGADVFGLLLGLSVLVLNIVAFSIYLSTRKGG